MRRSTEGLRNARSLDTPGPSQCHTRHYGRPPTTWRRHRAIHRRRTCHWRRGTSYHGGRNTILVSSIPHPNVHIVLPRNSTNNHRWRQHPWLLGLRGRRRRLGRLTGNVCPGHLLGVTSSALSWSPRASIGLMTLPFNLVIISLSFCRGPVQRILLHLLRSNTESLHCLLGRSQSSLPVNLLCPVCGVSSGVGVPGVILSPGGLAWASPPLTG